MDLRMAVLVVGMSTVAALAPVGAAEHGPQDGTLSGVVTMPVDWTWERFTGTGALLVSDAGVVQLEWSETYEAGVRVAARVTVAFQMALGSGACATEIDDVAGTSQTTGSFRFVPAGELACGGAGASESQPDAWSLCHASALVWGTSNVGHQVKGWGEGMGHCQETQTPA